MVILVDNKEESLRRAKERVEKLNLSNVMIVHSNLNYFNANFQVVKTFFYNLFKAMLLKILKCIR